MLMRRSTAVRSNPRMDVSAASVSPQALSNHFMMRAPNTSLEFTARRPAGPSVPHGPSAFR
jgi:hypothetical protein